MSQHTLLALFALAFAHAVDAQSPTTTSLEPLASKTFTWPNIPYQVTGDQGGERGPQFGYNLCNSTTENQQSLCQTAFLNNIADFCMWSSSETNDTVGESEAREVAWCTQPGHGTRVIPPGAITGAQWLYAKNYVQVVGFIDQTKVGLNADDEGGELDPHGDDEQGNPIGGLFLTNGFGQSSSSFQSFVSSGNVTTTNTTYTQVIEWIDFIGGGMFCMKLCNPSDPDDVNLCQHIYDEVGCTYNAVADYPNINGTFEVCDSDDMADPGIFTTNGQLTTWHQPFSGTFSVPYQTSSLASSNCVTYSSEQLFAAAATDSAVATITGSASVTGSGSGAHGSATGSGSGSGSGSTSGAQSGAAARSYESNALPYIAVGFFTMIATMVTIIA
ncbi:hypothetical protein EW145_g7111 [Phellinidium pouzarii]|uniref:Macrofage activating glycoprotein n=1 Tax=Phellinidium pouzarii TaxID=167371 RepID=A0A4S4KTJ9_9AGAM|nr:hypothetical protein EW145_g7111 [Phellinidium pouzarii]